MKSPARTLALALLVLLLPSARVQAQTSRTAAPLALVNVTVIDATGARPRRGMTVLLEGGRILAIGKAGRLRPPAGARTIEAAGKFLIPGLWDMHAHVWDAEALFPAYLANGVTGVRDMGTVLEPWLKWRARVEAGEMLGPRSFVCGKIVDGFKPFFYFFVRAATEDEGRERVRELKTKGADFIKVYERLSREVYFAVADEAHRQRITFAGHVPPSVRASEASDAGQKSIEHLTGVALECSTEEARLRASAVKALDEARAEGLKPEEVSQGIERAYDLARRAPLDTYDREKAARLFARFRRNGTWQTPTLVALEDFGGERQAARVAPYLKYFPPFMRALMLPEAGGDAVERERRERLFRSELALVGGMRRAGVRFLAGSDAPNAYSVPGFGLHEELALLVRAGFTPLEAIQAATRDAAEFMGRLDAFGTVETGKAADLVLLDADPLADIRNTRRIAAVILNGRLIDRPQLQAMLEGLEAKAGAKKN